jgi:hypothetical protein
MLVADAEPWRQYDAASEAESGTRGPGPANRQFRTETSCHWCIKSLTLSLTSENSHYSIITKPNGLSRPNVLPFRPTSGPSPVYLQSYARTMATVRRVVYNVKQKRKR